MAVSLLLLFSPSPVIFPSSCQTRFLFQIPSVCRIHLHFLFPSQSGPTLGSVFSHHRTASMGYQRHRWEGNLGLAELKYNQESSRDLLCGLGSMLLGSWCTHHFENLGAQGLVCDMSLKYLICYKTSKNLSVQKRK